VGGKNNVPLVNVYIRSSILPGKGGGQSARGCATHGPDPPTVTRSAAQSLGRGGVGLSAFGRARLAKSAGRTQKTPRVRVKLISLSERIFGVARGVRARGVRAGGVRAGGCGLSLGDGRLCRRGAPPACLHPFAQWVKKKDLRRGTCCFAFTFEGDKIPVLI